MFCWGSAGRLRPSRMCWLKHNYNDPRYELVKWRQPSLRRMPRLGIFLDREGKVERDREGRQRFPGKTGEWPRHQKKRRSQSGVSIKPADRRRVRIKKR